MPKHFYEIIIDLINIFLFGINVLTLFLILDLFTAQTYFVDINKKV
jgi:hypothetical protein